jgi:hypothetical protein
MFRYLARVDLTGVFKFLLLHVFREYSKHTPLWVAYVCIAGGFSSRRCNDPITY